MAGKPNIRFSGYTDAWEQRKFGNFTELKSASRVHKDEWTSEGVPFYRSSDVMSAINGTQNEKAFISEELYEKLSSVSGKLEKGDVLVTGGGSVGNPYIVPDNKPLYTKDADLLWIKNQGRFDAYFIYEFFFSPTFRKYLESISHVGTIAHYTITQLTETPVSLPSLEEQKKVGDYFRSIDNLITLHQRKCDETKELKKYMLQKMFPKNGETKPEIRFAGFTGDWEQRKFSDVVEIGSGMDYKHLGEGDIPVYGTGGYMLSVDAALSEEKDAIGIGRKGTIDKPYILRAPFWTVDTLFYCIPKDGYDLDFTSCLFQNIDWKKKDESTGVPSLSKVIINNVETAAPSYEEQRKIGDYFKGIDNLITLHQRKCDETKELKKYMLQNMFPQN
ncbi:type I restriction modification system S subunit HsdS1 (plasmid) [Butyrivibrio proteoclasticus B316]|uniref:Type I restriction modification system S subunit HsdS1 n=1 Tax=Butyrivibrio proteoclasticus (strain ATCC 51982 / DSM 14932 / B316) TaxID=515622 RepID=E0S4Y2_BUTPB|nr:restriction endonuclease subunit S [Butyrivibrio proteoclasticus]ADL36464.1 type I restriction modification system S subunit HsdS1 [Butyrivibrio proteoclasticus B316]